MQQLQQTIFHNLSKKTAYISSSKTISRKHNPFPKYRQQQIANEFELVDLHNRGKLTQLEIINYLSDKYQWVNTNILKELFRGMEWDQDQAVTKQEFVSKYLQREKKLYHEINGLRYYESWVKTLQDIFINQMKIGKPRVYFYVQIRSVSIYNNSQLVQWMDTIIQSQNHTTKTQYQIQQSLYNAAYPSYQIWLPARGDTFFLKFTFTDPHKREYVFGQTYLNVTLQNEMNKLTNLDLHVVKNGMRVGDCVVCVYAEPEMEKVRQQLREIKEKGHGYAEVSHDKVKEYEYLQFLWGMRHKYPHKISYLDDVIPYINRDDRPSYSCSWPLLTLKHHYLLPNPKKLVVCAPSAREIPPIMDYSLSDYA